MLTARRMTTAARAATAAAIALGALGLTAPGALAAAPGTLDQSFGSHGLASTGSTTRLFADAVQSDGRVIAVGETGAGSAPRVLVARFTASGALDSSFGHGGLAVGPAIAGTFAGDSVARAVAIQPDGKIVVVGTVTDSNATSSYGMLIERFDANGSLDPTFGVGGERVIASNGFGTGNGVALAPDGSIIAVGSANASGSGGVTPRVLVARLTSQGAPDVSFAGRGSDVIDLGPYSVANAVAIQPNGAIVIAGSERLGLQVPVALIARLTSSGALDRSFAGSGYYYHQYSRAGSSSGFNALALQSNGEILAAGAAVDGPQGADAFVVRYSASGAQDASFGSGGAAYASSAVNSPPGSGGVPGAQGVAILSNGDVVAAGRYADGAVSYATLWGFSSRGALDSAFGRNGVTVTPFGSALSDELNGVALAPNGEILAVGDSQASFNGAYTGIVARYFGAGQAPPPPATPLRATLSGLGRSYRTAYVARHGLRFRVFCNQACALRVTLTISAAQARRLHVKTTYERCTGKGRRRRCRKSSRYQTTIVARAERTLRGAATTSFTLRLSRFFSRAFSRQRSVALTMRIAAISPSGHSGVAIVRSVTFRR